MGNLRSVQKGFERVGVAAVVTRDAGRIAAADGVVLPGVGAFGACMDNLRGYGLV
jgi:glutamine amidotransferase